MMNNKKMLTILASFVGLLSLTSCSGAHSIEDEYEIENRTKYTITWKNYDGSILQVMSVGEGSKPYYDGVEPCRTADDSVYYTFLGWDKKITSATCDTEYVAKFKENPYMVIGEGWTTINRYCFPNNYELRYIKIADSVKKIDDETFYYWNNLRRVILPEGLETMGNSVFGNCFSLEKISIPSTLTSIPCFTFQNCNKLVSIDLPNTIETIDIGAFGSCTSLSSIKLPSSLKKLCSNAFGGCTSLREVTFTGNSLTTIEDNVFHACKSLKELTLPNGLKSIGGSVFYDCDSLEKVTFPSSLTYYGFTLFEGCHNISTVKLPRGLTSIDKEFGNSSIKDVYIPKEITSINIQKFVYSGVCNVHFEAESKPTECWLLDEYNNFSFGETLDY